MDRKERTKKAVHFGGPDCVPVLHFNSGREESDIILIDVVKHFEGPEKDRSEWGFQWERQDGTMGQPKARLIEHWDALDAMSLPDPLDPDRFATVEPTMKCYGDRYYVASLVLSGFTVMHALRGFTSTLEDLYLDRENLDRLADIIFGFEEDIIRQLPALGFDAVAFFDDWGTQDSLMISPAMWRDFFAPRYQRQFDLAHSLGLDVYFHSCGWVKPILGDFITLEVDILNISQPNLFDIEALGREFAGKVCFMCPVSYQTTAISGTSEEIYSEAYRLITNLGRPNGGFIGYVEEYSSIGMPEENYQYCVEAFKKYGKLQ
jgi:uroporphyrinogen decarboxylase